MDHVTGCDDELPYFSDISSIHAEDLLDKPKPSKVIVPSFMRKAKSWQPAAPPNLHVSLAPTVSPQVKAKQKELIPALAPATSRQTHKAIRKVKSVSYLKLRAKLSLKCMG